MPDKATISRICLHCGTSFLRRPSDIRKGGGKYCSRQCVLSARSTDPVASFWSRVHRSDRCWEQRKLERVLYHPSEPLTSAAISGPNR